MLPRIAARLLCAVAVAIAAPASAGKEVTLAHQGLTLNADLELAPGKTLADGVILLTHGGLAHRDMESLVYFRSLLLEKGYSLLSINLALGLDNRHGMYDCKTVHRHRNEDAVEEIGAWVRWLEGQGVKRLVLAGHSRGGAQTALYAAERDGPVIRSVVLLAPAIADNTSAATYRQRFKLDLAPLLAKAEGHVKAGKGDTVLEHLGLMTCADSPVTATSLLSYYSPRARTDTPTLLKSIKKPTLVVVAENDQVVVGLDKKIGGMVDGKRLHMKVVETADHLFRDLYADDAVEAIDGFLRSLGK